MSSEVLTIRVRPDLKSQLDQLGQILQRSKSYLAEQAIARYIEDLTSTPIPHFRGLALA